MRRCTRDLPRDEFVDLVCEEFSSLRDHIFRAYTQYNQISSLREKLDPNTEITIHMDYSENYSCVMQDEPSQVFFDRRQITVHPLVVHYHSDDELLRHQSYVAITDERSHAAPTTVAIVTKLIPELKKL